MVFEGGKMDKVQWKTYYKRKNNEKFEEKDLSIPELQLLFITMVIILLYQMNGCKWSRKRYSILKIKKSIILKNIKIF